MSALHIINFVSKMKSLWVFFMLHFSTMFRGKWQSCFRPSAVLSVTCSYLLSSDYTLPTALDVFTFTLSRRVYFLVNLSLWKPFLVDPFYPTVFFYSFLTSFPVFKKEKKTKKWIYVSCDAIYCRDIYISSHLNFWNSWRNGVQAFYSSPASSISILHSFKDFFPLAV